MKVETDEGLYGWGEAYTQSDRDVQITAHIDQLRRYLIGRDPRNIKHFVQWAYDDFAGRRGAMDFWCAVSRHRTRALGHHRQSRRYARPICSSAAPAAIRFACTPNGWSGGGGGPEALAERAQAVVEMGFNAMKFDPIPGPWRTFVSREVEDAAIENVRVVREAVGWDVDILVEMHRRLAPMHARRIGREIERYRPFWYEEPVLAENVDALAAVKRDVNIPVVTGEELYTKFEFREVFEKQAADILNPDVCNVGGILELKEIAAMAEPYFVVVSPHNFNSTTLGLAATLQVSAAIPNFLITEYFVNLEDFGRDIAKQPFEVVDGYIAVPDSPGIGIDLDEDALAKYPYKPFDPRSPLQYWQEGP